MDHLEAGVQLRRQGGPRPDQVSRAALPRSLRQSDSAAGSAGALWARRFSRVPRVEHLGLANAHLGVFISTIVCAHCTFTINSLTHLWGSKRYESKDESRNNLWLALLTFGEGWHNNHHHYPGATRQGFYWWEIDMTFYGLWIMSKLGLIWDLNAVPEKVRASHHIDRST